MPGFIKNPKDEEKWKKMKDAVSRSKGKPESEFTDRDWALANYLWHKSEGEIEKAEELAKALGTKVPSVSVPNPAKVGSTSVKMPKSKKLADPFGKPSLFFKSEDVKQPSIQKLRDFLEQRHRKQ